MGTVFLKVFNMGFTASWLILVVVILRLLLRRAPKWISCLLWALVAVKLLCPFSLESAVSLIPSNEPLPEKIITGNTFRVNTGVGIMDSPVNEYLEDHYYEGVSVAADNGFHVMTALGMIWITGVILLLLYSFISYYRLHRLTRASVRLKDNIFACDAVDTPFILGVVKPRIYLPSAMESAQTEYVLAHEWAHLKRGDHIWKPVGFLILTVYWFWPPCLLSYILFCRDIELACDERVIASLKQENRRSYAEALLSCSVKQSMVTACPLAFGEVGVKERIKNVLHYKKPAFWFVLVAIIACLAVAVCFLTNPKKEEESPVVPEEEQAIVTQENAEQEPVTQEEVSVQMPDEYQLEAVKRLKNVDREKLRALPFDPNVISFEDVLCIGELPENKIRVYGYNDDEISSQGVAVEMEFPAEGREIYYYDWYYVTPRGILPDLYWDKEKERLSIACTIYTGTGADAQELHILQRYGTMQETNLGLDEYSDLLKERIDWQFEETTRKLTLTDKKTGKILADLTVPTDLGERVTDLELGTISKFILGEEIRFVVSPGYVVDDMWGGAVYDEMPELTFELLFTDGGNGHFEFALGEMVER